MSGEPAKVMENPCRALLPRAWWPSEPPRSNVRDSKGNGWLIVERGLQLVLFGVVPDVEIFTDDIGRRMMNGAMAVTKTHRSSDPIFDSFYNIFQRFSAFVNKTYN